MQNNTFHPYNLCMTFSLLGYYNGTIFHRVVQDFIIQGGDPTGTGTGGESIYGRPFRVSLVLVKIIMFAKCNIDIILMFCSNFQDEFHTRLRFIRRGLVAMANAGPHDNGSQFFFTLGRADELNNKHTIFGKVSIPYVLNLLQSSYLSLSITDYVKVLLTLHKLHSLVSHSMLFSLFLLRSQETQFTIFLD